MCVYVCVCVVCVCVCESCVCVCVPTAECLLKLFVSTERGETALLCDEGV